MSPRPDFTTEAILTRVHNISLFVTFSANRSAEEVLGEEVESWYPHITPNAVRATLRWLIEKGLLDGCGCGCRGDFTVTDAGRELIDADLWTFITDDDANDDRIRATNDLNDAVRGSVGSVLDPELVAAWEQAHGMKVARAKA